MTPETHTSSRPLVAVAAIAALTAIVWMHARSTRAWLVDFGVGDALAYVRVAWNVARGAGVTYDGVQATNGFHPLWLLLNVPLMLGAQEPWERLDLARAFWSIVAVCAAIAWGRVVRRATGSTLAACATALVMAASGWSLYTLYQGLETPLVLLLVALAFLDAQELNRPAAERNLARNGLRAGLVLGLGVLARLDAVFVLVPLAGLLFARLGRRAGALMAAAGAATVAPVLLWNLREFGSIVPVSGLVRQQDGFSLAPLIAWCGAFERLTGKVHLPGVGLVVVSGLVALVALVPWLAIRSRVVSRAEPLLVLFPAALLHWLYYAVRMREFNVPWHLYLQIAAAFVAAGMVVAAIERRAAGTPGRRLTILLAVIVFVAVGDVAYARIKSVRRPEVSAALETGDWLARTLPDGSTYLMYDSWYAAIRTPRLHPVDMTGLVGDAAMVPLARDHRFDDMVARFRPRAVVLQVSGPCDGFQPAVLWASGTVISREPFREAVLDPGSFAAAWRSLPREDRQSNGLRVLGDTMVCSPAATR